VSGASRIAAFAAILAIVLGGAVAVGQAINPDGADDNGSAHEASEGHGDTDDHGAELAAEGVHPVRGLAVAEGGLRLVLDQHELARGAEEQLSFQIVDDAGDPVRDFDVEHERRMHLIVVRRDLVGFQHLHPSMRDDGTWSTPVRIPRGGSYRVFADFSREGEPHTLASDLHVDGPAALKDLPAPGSTFVTEGGYEVELEDTHAAPGEAAELGFTVTRDDQPIDVEPYLGADGHLVALREGDLAFLHVHPTEHGEAEEQADAIGFEATFPTTGEYRLFLQFKHEGRVATAAFTLEVE
jgi:hypothetical protein